MAGGGDNFNFSQLTYKAVTAEIFRDGKKFRITVVGSWWETPDVEI